jgi:GTP-binding protein HflX
LIHVLDISHPNFEDHFNVVNETLNEIDKTEKPTIILFNKIDAYQAPKNDDLVEDLVEITTLESLKKSWMAKMNKTKCVFISAQEKENIEELKAVLYEEVKAIFRIRYPYNDFLF